MRPHDTYCTMAGERRFCVRGLWEDESLRSPHRGTHMGTLHARPTLEGCQAHTSYSPRRPPPRP